MILRRSLAYAASLTSRAWTLCGNYATAIAQLDEAIAWADEKGSVFWRALLTGYKGWVFALTGEASDAVQMITSAIAAWRSTGSIAAMTTWLPCLAIAYADLGQFDNAWRCIEEAMATIKITKEKIFEAEVNRIAGEIALKSPGRDASKAEIVFRARHRARAPTTSQILGTPRRNEPRAALARPGQGAASARTAGSGLRLVYGGVRHARSEGGEGAAGGVGRVTPRSGQCGPRHEHIPGSRCSIRRTQQGKVSRAPLFSSRL